MDPSLLSRYEQRLWIEVDRILYQNYLTPRTVSDFWGGDRDAVIWHLRQMKERVVRAIVVSEYVELDDLLNRHILNAVVPQARRRTKRRDGVVEMLERLYPQQKLEVLQAIREVPDKIRSRIMALNTLRNSMAHRFHLRTLPKSKRLYKGKYDLFTKAGLSKFRTDMWEVHVYFDPALTDTALQLVRNQRRRRRTRPGA